MIFVHNIVKQCRNLCATVDATGKVTPVKTGKVTITVATDKASTTAEVEVKNYALGTVSPDKGDPSNEHLPHNYPGSHTVVSRGTHDNDTIVVTTAAGTFVILQIIKINASVGSLWL